MHRSDRLEEAAALYEAVVASWPDDAGVHGNLAGIRLAQGRRLEALQHIHRACELGRWADQVVGRNFAYILRSVLENLDRRHQASHWRRYQDWGKETSGIELPVSVLVPDPNRDLERRLLGLANQQRLPAEVLVAGDTGFVPAGLPFPVRGISCLDAETNRYSRINALAKQANGQWLLVVQAGNVLEPDHLMRMSEAMACADGWAYCSSISESEPFVTDGYEILRGDTLAAGEAGLLVAKSLHERVGGYAPDKVDPDADYCLRLLWAAEPVKVVVRSMRTIQPTLHQTVVTEYLNKAVAEQTSPNPFAPSARNWGMSFYKYVMDQGWLLSLEAVRRMVADIEAHLLAVEQRVIQPQPGINLVGSALGEFGLGENMRAFARAAKQGNIPNGIVDMEFGSARKSDLSMLDRLGDAPNHACSVFFFNPDLAQIYKQSLDSLVFQRRSIDFNHHKIGYWLWELERFPSEWRYALDRVDEIWVPSEFIAKTIAAITEKPVIKIPTPVGANIQVRFNREDFGLPRDRFLFLFSFSFASFPARKNPESVVRAFKQAFPNRKASVGLVLKSTHGADWLEALQELRDQIGDDPRIVLMDRFMTRNEVFGLQNVCDCYVSLHRSEGLGLGMAESMCLGKPVIGTGYSGNLEFMTEENSGLVRYIMTPVQPGDYYLCDSPGYFWAEPDIGHAAELMVRVFEDREYRASISQRGRQDILSKFSHAVAADAMRARLREIGIL